MAHTGRLLYLDIVDDGADPASFLPTDPVEDLLCDQKFLDGLVYSDVSGQPLRRKRWTKFHVLGALKMMGCKPMHADIITEAVYNGLSGDESRQGSMNSVTITTTAFLRVLQYQLLRFGYARKSTILDFSIACDLKAGEHSLIVLLGGTSGCGKSTLASLLAARLGVTTVVSTDSVRHIMRNSVDPKAVPVLFASTYHAGEALTDVPPDMSATERTLQGFLQQSRMVQAQMVRLMEMWEARRQTVIVEGVHLDTEFMVEMMRRHRSCIPFLIHISNDAKHRERFAVRARYMTLSPHVNKYVKYFENIRTIQKYLTDLATAYHVPMVDNTNIDRSLAAVHATVINCLRKGIVAGMPLYDKETGRATGLSELYARTTRKTNWRSKDILEVIHDKRRRWSWPVDEGDGGASAPASRPADASTAEPAAPASVAIAVASASHVSPRAGRGHVPTSAAGPAHGHGSGRDGFASARVDDALGSAAVVSPRDDGDDQSGSEVSVDELNKFSVDEFVGS